MNSLSQRHLQEVYLYSLQVRMYARTAVKWVLVDGRVCRLGTTYNYIVREEV